MINMEETIRIPDERIGVLIGPNGTTKRQIMKRTNTKIVVDSKEGEVTITGEGEEYFKASDIVKAIGRGFSPIRAFRILEGDYLLKIITIVEYTGKSRGAQEAKRGRVIGKDGIARREIEKKTSSLISVYGKTVTIIATPDNLEQATQAVELLLQGSSHDTMGNFLERKGKTRFEL